MRALPDGMITTMAANTQPATKRAAKSTPRAASTDTAKVVTSAIKALVDENAQLRADHTAAEQKASLYDKMMAAAIATP